jgi:hypothetical protein
MKFWTALLRVLKYNEPVQTPKSLSLRRIFVVVGIVSLFISYLGLWIRLISDPVQRTGSDFIHFYTAGRIAQNEGMSRVYDLALQQDYEEEQVGFPLADGQVLPYNHLPFLIPILQIIITANYVHSFYNWVIIMIVLYIIGIIILCRVLRQAGIDQNSTLLTAIGGLLFLPLFFSLMNGQDTAVLFLGVAIWIYGLISEKEMAAGLGLSLTTIRPHIALIMALPMLFSYRKVFLGFMLGSGILALFSYSILGIAGTRDFIDILIVSAGGEWYGMKQFAMFNLIGLLMRTTPWLAADVIRLLGWVVYGIAIVGLCILWARNKDLQDGKIGLTVTLALFAVPHLHFHDLTLLLMPIYELIRSSTRSGWLKTSIAVVLPIVISLLLLLSNASRVLQYTVPYLLMLALAGYPYYLKYKQRITVPHQS